jgi:uracil-DNA glycosylase
MRTGFIVGYLLPVNADEYPPAPVPERPTLPRLRAAATTCRACNLSEHATQVVVGEGPARARVMLVGEQPGDREDREGHPFVGPAGQILNRGLPAPLPGSSRYRPAPARS